MLAGLAGWLVCSYWPCWLMCHVCYHHSDCLLESYSEPSATLETPSVQLIASKRGKVGWRSLGASSLCSKPSPGSRRVGLSCARAQSQCWVGQVGHTQPAAAVGLGQLSGATRPLFSRYFALPTLVYFCFSFVFVSWDGAQRAGEGGSCLLRQQ